MAHPRQAVLEFDAAVRVPWRPLLAAVDGSRHGRGPAPAGSGPRVGGHLRPVPDRPVADRPVARGVRPPGPAGEAPRGRRDPARPGGRPLPPRSGAGALRGGCRPAPARVRLTRRGRRLVGLLVVGGAVVLGSSIATLVGGGDGGLRLAGGSGVVVEPGDTVWSIAREVAGTEQDVRVVVDSIHDLNDLEGSVVVPGQVLVLP